MASDNGSLYDQIGGQPTIDRLIDNFYVRVLDDPELEPFFRDVSMDSLRRMQREFFAAALGGPVQYSGLELSYVHQGRGIRIHHFSRFTDHLLETLQDIGVPEAASHAILGEIAKYAGDITGNVSSDG